ncbi:hypothetical protein ACN28S_00090 [Cystobacter fuscus]
MRLLSLPSLSRRVARVRSSSSWAVSREVLCSVLSTHEPRRETAAEAHMTVNSSKGMAVRPGVKRTRYNGWRMPRHTARQPVTKRPRRGPSRYTANAGINMLAAWNPPSGWRPKKTDTT